MESWYTKLFSMTLVKVKMHLEGLNGWNEIVKPKKLKVIVWQRKLESHLTFFSKPNKTCNYQYCKWWLYIISNQPQQPAVQINLILATHFGDGTDLRRSPQVINLVTHLVTNLVTYFVTNFVINFVTNVMENIVIHQIKWKIWWWIW